MQPFQMQKGLKAIEPNRTPTKVFRVLNHLLQHGSLNRFEAQLIGDHCLNTTISTIANMYRLVIHRVPERAKDHWGAIFTVMRYSLPKSSVPYAEFLLANQGYLLGSMSEVSA